MKPCSCAPALVTKYQKRISGPLLDRIDIHIEVPQVDYEKLSGDRVGESSESIRMRVQAARNIQQVRFTNPKSLFSNNGSSSDIVCNADMRVGEIRQFCKLPEDGQRLMRAAMTQLNLSARTYHRTLRVKLARTIADLTGAMKSTICSSKRGWANNLLLRQYPKNRRMHMFSRSPLTGEPKSVPFGI